jgi:ubiquinone/menaquinone biosynthesis C-methylase UbiE
MDFYSHHVFPYLLEWVSANPAMEYCREIVLGDAVGNVLEIGFGTGRNLAHYPLDLVSLTGIDANAGMNRKAYSRIARVPFTVKHHVMDAEKLTFDDGSFDTVVSTWTLCSISDVRCALKEVYRVLKPGGYFLFVEHGRSDEFVVRRWQDRLVPVFRVLGDGCHPNRDIRGLIESQNLRLTQLDCFYLKGVPKVGGYTYRGAARKSFKVAALCASV